MGGSEVVIILRMGRTRMEGGTGRDGRKRNGDKGRREGTTRLTGVICVLIKAN